MKEIRERERVFNRVKEKNGRIKFISFKHSNRTELLILHSTLNSKIWWGGGGKEKYNKKKRG